MTGCSSCGRRVGVGCGACEQRVTVGSCCWPSYCQRNREVSCTPARWHARGMVPGGMQQRHHHHQPQQQPSSNSQVVLIGVDPRAPEQPPPLAAPEHRARLQAGALQRRREARELRGERVAKEHRQVGWGGPGGSARLNVWGPRKYSDGGRARVQLSKAAPWAVLHVLDSTRCPCACSSGQCMQLTHAGTHASHANMPLSPHPP